jgi:hypothetical protein
MFEPFAFGELEGNVGERLHPCVEALRETRRRELHGRNAFVP